MVFGKHINRYYLKYAGMLLLGILALIIVDVGQLEIPRLYKMVINGINDSYVIVDGVSYSFDMDFLLDFICRPLIVVVFMMVTGRFLWRVCFFGSAIKMETNLRDRMFDHCKDLSQQYFQMNKVGDLMSLFTNDLETVQDCFGNGVLSSCDALFLGGLSLYKMFSMNKVLTLFALIPMAFLFVAGNVMGKHMSKKWEERQEAFSKLSDYSQESFSGIAVIKAFHKELKELHAFRKLNKENEAVNVEYTKIATLLDILIVLFVESVICVILGYGGYLVYTGVFNAGEMVEFIGYFVAIVWPIEAVAIIIEATSRGRASVKRISELLDAGIDVTDKENVREVPDDFEGAIEFRNLSFTHPGAATPALDSVSFAIKAGENVGIIGRTGSGKTTIVDLITRIYNVKEGMLFVDGVDVNDYSIKSLRDHIAYVPQDNFLFSDTIKNNIAFCEEGEIAEEPVDYAAYLAGVKDNILEFSNQYETVLGERGVTVSGGQKQRISIARALMKNAEILILDDSLSAVDTKTERFILDNLRRERNGKTTLFIAHRISTVSGMDKIILIDEGKVVDIGTDEELSERCPMYQELVNLQKLEDERKESDENA